jgi:hypothetical protein
MYILFKKTPLHVVLHCCNGACRINLCIKKDQSVNDVQGVYCENNLRIQSFSVKMVVNMFTDKA